MHLANNNSHKNFQGQRYYSAIDGLFCFGAVWILKYPQFM